MRSKRIFTGAEPSPSSLRDATSPERGRFIRADRKMPKSSPEEGAKLLDSLLKL